MIKTIAGSTVFIRNSSEMLSKLYDTDIIDIRKATVVGRQLVSKADAEKKIISAPYSMRKLCDLIERDEYHRGCIDAIVRSAVQQVKSRNAQVQKWLEQSQYPACENEATVLGEMLRYYVACGNGFVIKMRSVAGQWVGMERMLPQEVQIIERYDEYGFMKPDYVQVKNLKRRDFAYADIIQLKESTHKSDAWGLACLPIAMNVEILDEIKTFDYNNFKNGLLLDYFIIVEGGTLRDGTITDDDGNEVITDAYAEIEKQLLAAKGNKNSHSSILIECENKDVKIRLEPLRQHDKDGGFLSLKKDLREGIFAYHRVPPRIVAQLVSGQLGGDYASEMKLFYFFVVKPLQRKLALALAYEFQYEFQWDVKPDDFDFGNMDEILLSADESLFKAQRNS